jgi:phosphoglycolate phosphatase-like HAD superfamily hydrolase
MLLVLFDIDGTLVHINSAGRATVEYALMELFGTAGPIQQYSFAGKTDLQIIYDLATEAGVPLKDIHAGLPDLFDLMAERGRILFRPEIFAACPGVKELLSRLHQMEDAVLGLQTGNAHTTAPLKLAAAGIDPDQFPVVAYGSESLERRALPIVAWTRAMEISGHRFNGTTTVVIGDTPADIDCAVANGAKSLAVATGTFSSTQLAQHRPDALFADLGDTGSVINLFKTWGMN